jgi:hypothetical protein
MLSSPVVDIAIGLTFVYLMFSLGASRINEFVASRLQWRAEGLERGLLAMFNGPPAGPSAAAGRPADAPPAAGRPADAPSAAGRPADSIGTPLSAAAIKRHPEVAVLEAPLARGRRISYLPSRTLSGAVFDLLAPPATLLLDGIDRGRLSADGAAAFEAVRRHPDKAQVELLATTLTPDDDHNRTVVATLLDAVDRDPMARARTSLLKLDPDNPARRPLLRLLEDAGNDRDRFRSGVEDWFDEQMGRLSGWYKRRVQRWIIGYGIALTVLFNVDTLGIADALWRTPTERAAAAAVASAAAGKDINSVDTSLDGLRGLAVPIGWSAAHTQDRVSADPRRVPATPAQWLIKLAGWSITVAALAFGAPFWFDALGKLVRVRNTGEKPKPAR